jgi:hypothetical protein
MSSTIILGASGSPKDLTLLPLRVFHHRSSPVTVYSPPSTPQQCVIPPPLAQA